jgi:hypothetical protein
VSSVVESNARYAEYQARERRNNIAMMAKRILVLQHGHHGRFWETPDANLHEVHRQMARLAFSAASAFYEELTAFDTDPTDPVTGKGGA